MQTDHRHRTHQCIHPVNSLERCSSKPHSEQTYTKHHRYRECISHQTFWRKYTHTLTSAGRRSVGRSHARPQSSSTTRCGLAAAALYIRHETPRTVHTFLFGGRILYIYIFRTCACDNDLLSRPSIQSIYVANYGLVRAGCSYNMHSRVPPPHPLPRVGKIERWCVSVCPPKQQPPATNGHPCV